ncbi:MAG: ATP-binding cassette domain-containing protein, partial [Desulfomonilaceae bacterium]
MLAKDSESEPVTEAVQVLDLRNVVKVFKSGRRTVEALCGVSFQVRPGVITGLIGPDGAGKTTIMRLAAGLLTPIPAAGFVALMFVAAWTVHRANG